MVSPTARANLEAHIAAERAGDIEGLLAPLSEDPSYVIPGYVLRGRQAVRALYEAVLPNLNAALLDEYRRAIDDPRVVRWGDDHCVLEYTDDYPFHCDMIVVVHFEGDRIKSENTYYRSLEQPRLIPESLLSIPGVEPLKTDKPSGEAS